MSFDKLNNRLEIYDEKLKSDEVLHRIGLRLTNRMKIEITRLKAIDTGRLRNSISYRVSGKKLEVFAFATNYAKFVEFGTSPSAKMARFLFWKMGQKESKKKSKNIIQWSRVGTEIQARIKPRPYFRKTIEAEKGSIYKLLKEYYSQV